MIRLASLALALAVSLPASAETLIGQSTVVDGDTLEIRGERVRLSAIDAPESRQFCGDARGNRYPCGRQAAFALSDRIGSANVRCEGRTRDRYRRLIAECFIGTTNLNAWMVENGWAVAYRRYGGDAYDRQERAAKANRRGVWQGEFVQPEQFRRNRGN